MLRVCYGTVLGAHSEELRTTVDETFRGPDALHFEAAAYGSRKHWAGVVLALLTSEEDALFESALGSLVEQHSQARRYADALLRATFHPRDDDLSVFGSLTMLQALVSNMRSVSRPARGSTPVPSRPPLGRVWATRRRAKNIFEMSNPPPRAGSRHGRDVDHRNVRTLGRRVAGDDAEEAHRLRHRHQRALLDRDFHLLRRKRRREGGRPDGVRAGDAGRRFVV